MTLEFYALINNYTLNVKPFTPYTEPPKRTADFTVSDVKPITLAEYHPDTKGLITAHRLKDYRRRNFTLTVLPDVHLVIDDLLSEVEDINELL